MKFEGLFGKPRKEKSPEQRKMDNQQRAAALGAAALAGVAAGAAYEVHNENIHLDENLVAATSPASSETLAHVTKPGETPLPIVVSRPETVTLGEKPVVEHLAEKPVVEQLDEKKFVVKEPEL